MICNVLNGGEGCTKPSIINKKTKGGDRLIHIEAGIKAFEYVYRPRAAPKAGIRKVLSDY